MSTLYIIADVELSCQALLKLFLLFIRKIFYLLFPSLLNKAGNFLLFFLSVSLYRLTLSKLCESHQSPVLRGATMASSERPLATPTIAATKWAGLGEWICAFNYFNHNCLLALRRYLWTASES
jgi:hypothetical protein